MCITCYVCTWDQVDVLILMNNTDERHFAGRRPVTDMEVYDDT